MLDRDTEKRVVEALVFVSDEPITIEQIRQVLSARTPEEVLGLLEEIESDLQAGGSGLALEKVAGGYRFSTRPELAPWIRTYFRHRNRSRLSSAGLETLAVIAYKQPVTGPEIQEIRGVDPQGAIKTLLEKGLIRIAGKKRVVGRPFLYATTRHFLVHFGLPSIDDLPPIEDFGRLAGEVGSPQEPEGDGEGLFEAAALSHPGRSGAADPARGEGAGKDGEGGEMELGAEDGTREAPEDGDAGSANADEE